MRVFVFAVAHQQPPDQDGDEGADRGNHAQDADHGLVMSSRAPVRDGQGTHANGKSQQ